MIKVSDGGTLYLEPPYNAVERAHIEAHLYGPPIAIYRSAAPAEPAAPPPEPPKPVPNLSRRRLAEMRRAAKELTSRLGLDPILGSLFRRGRPLTAKAYLDSQGVPEEQLGFDEQRTLNLLRELEGPARERHRRDR